MSNSGVVHGGIRRNTTPAQEMAAFDALPLELRDVLRRARLEFPAVAVFRAWQGGRHPEAIVGEIEATDRKLTARLPHLVTILCALACAAITLLPLWSAMP